LKRLINDTKIILKHKSMNAKNDYIKRGMVAVVTLGVMISIAIVFHNKNKSGPTSQLVKVTLAASKNPWTSLALIAEANGYFKDEGLDLKIAYQDGGRYCLDALVSKSAEFATIVEVNVSYLGFTGNKNVAVVGSIVESTSTGIIARRSAGIEKAEDLKGMTLAFSPGTGSELFTIRFLEEHGLQLDDVKMRKMQPIAIQGAMIAKEVDAACTWDPFIENSRRALGDDAITFFDRNVYLGYMHIAVRSDWAAEHRDEVQAFLRAVKRASEFIAESPSEAQAIVAEKLQ
jgi:ABC-type nitrate/sulfonate/bicarbonate transport system substrate-binding protein